MGSARYHAGNFSLLICLGKLICYQAIIKQYLGLKRNVVF